MNRTAARRTINLILLLFLWAPLPAFASDSDARSESLRFARSPVAGMPRAYSVRAAEETPLWSSGRADESLLLLRVDNRILRLDNSHPGVRSEVLRDGANEFVQQWIGGGVEVTLSLRAEGAEPGALIHGVFDIVNVGRRSASIGLRLIMDTWLGEGAAAHFHFAPDEGTSLVPVDRERSFDAEIPFLVSGGEDGALAVLPGRSSEALEFGVANIRRLSDSAWRYRTGRARGFSLTPFSINDSAMDILYDRERLTPGERRSLELWFSVGESVEAARLASGFVPDARAIAGGGEVEPESGHTALSEVQERHRDETTAEGESTGDTVAPARIPDGDDDEPGRARANLVRELNRTLGRLREISDGERRAEPGELDELREELDRLRDLRDSR